MTSSEIYLIVKQQRSPQELPALLKDLTERFQLDAYQSRQRLTGRGMSLLARGPREALERISEPLGDSGFEHWLVTPSRPGFAPRRIRALQVDSGQISYSCQTGPVIFPKGAKVLAVFADLSGALIDRNVQQLLSSNAYRGRDNIRYLEEHKVRKTIIQGQPVLDLYLLDDNHRVCDAVRVFPGKFNPQGLGEHATASSRQNLDRVLRLAEEYAGEIHLFTDFGLVNLPGCQLHRDNPEHPETQRRNLTNLARYGWLMADLLRAGPVQGSRANRPAKAAAVPSGQSFATAEQSGIPALEPVTGTLARETLSETINQTDPVEANSEPAESALPAPPQGHTATLWRTPGFWLGSMGSLAVTILGVLFSVGDLRPLAWVVRFAITTGAAQTIAALLMLWYAFHFLRLKRQIENTPTSRVRSIAMGMVEVKGRAIRKYALLSPMTHTPCTFYRLTKYRRDRNNHWRANSVSSSDNVPFLLEDETGRVEINPAGCRVSAGTRQEDSPALSGLTQLAGGDDEKWLEEVIVEGTLLYVLGFASVKPEEGPDRRQKTLSALRELKADRQKLLAFDRDGDGDINPEEWDLARAAVDEQITRETLQSRQQRRKQEEHIMIGKKAGRPLVISENQSEEQLTARYLYYSIPLFSAAAGAAGWAAYQLSAYLN